MTTLQKIVTEAKKIRKAHPNKYAKWTDYVKEASKKYKAAPVKKKVGNYKLNKTEFDETRIPIKPRKKTEKKKKVYAVTRAHGGQFKKITRVGATHSDKGSHNTTIRVVSGMYKLSGVEPHKGKYFIDWTYNGVKQKKYYDKMPKDVYRGFNGIYYMMVLTDKGTTLTPLINAKTNKIIKRK